MTTLDRREEFKDVRWSQGALLSTRITDRWTHEQRMAEHERERRTAFAHFSFDDSGRSRQFVYYFDTPRQCRAAVQEHNATLRGQRHE